MRKLDLDDWMAIFLGTIGVIVVLLTVFECI